MVQSTPQRLGGNSDSNTGMNDATSRNVLLTPDEIRQRRIDALDRNVQQPTTIVTFTNPDLYQEPANDEVDEELQAALALSLQDVVSSSVPLPTVTTTTTTTTTTTHKMVLEPNLTKKTFPSHSQQTTDYSPSSMASLNETIQTIYNTSQPFNVLYNVSKYNKLLWDDQLTTDSDKSRWVSQGIDVRSNNSDNSTIHNNYRKEVGGALNTINNDSVGEGIEILPQLVIEPQEQEHIVLSKLECIAQSHLPWGLIQQHGGPCGVLAALQAEMIRTLVFDSVSDSRTVCGSTTAATAAAAGTAIPEEMEGNNSTWYTNQSHDQPQLPIRRAMAHAIALVLSRAVLTPPSSMADMNNRTNDNGGCSIEYPTAVQIVLPTKGCTLTLHDLEHPPTLGTTSSSCSSALTVFTIPIIAAAKVYDTQQQGSAADSMNTTKRQKITLTSGNMNNDDDHETKATNFTLNNRIDQLARIVERFLLDDENCYKQCDITSSPPLDCFRGQGGVLLLVLSLIASRTIPRILEDFDDPIGTRLTGQFGHCSQELINLLLTGQAVSNVFDNTLSPSGDMVCRGIQMRPVIGYLTQLEAMRYCEVGGYYKMPLYPIWVVGSTSHFTVLFADPAALKESKSDILLNECRRVFKAVEGGEENGFIQTDMLSTVLKNLNIDIGGNNESDEAARIQTLAASLEVSGAGIILWDDFWKAVSRLLTGASLETVLQSGDTSMSISPINVDNVNGPPLLLTNFASNTDVPLKPEARRPDTGVATASYPNYIESDEEMARRLAAEWDNVGAEGMLALSNTPVSGLENSHPSTKQPEAMNDEEFAQYLQRQYDTENAVDAAISGGEGGSVAAMSGSPFQALSDTDDTASIPPTPTQSAFIGDDDLEDTKPAAQIAMSTESLPFEQYGDTFSLYHYNGLRGGILTPFRITRLTAEEAVGASIALNRGASGSSNGTQDLEDVVRTKWPSCAINWLGKTPPFID